MVMWWMMPAVVSIVVIRVAMRQADVSRLENQRISLPRPCRTTPSRSCSAARRS